MRTIAAMLVSLLLALPAFAQDDPSPAEEPVRNAAQYNLPKDSTLAIEGYDPVAYFPEGGGKPTKGKDTIALEHKGVTYRFASAAHRDLFLANPQRYEPAFGGWCAFAMADGDRVEIDPKNFLIEDDRLLLFYKDFFGNTRTSWTKAIEKNKPLAADADAEWFALAGESPRHEKVATAD